MRGLGRTTPFVVFNLSFAVTVGLLAILSFVPEWSADGDRRPDDRSRAIASHATGALQTIRAGIADCAQAFWDDVRGRERRDISSGRARSFERSAQACRGP